MSDAVQPVARQKPRGPLVVRVRKLDIPQGVIRARLESQGSLMWLARKLGVHQLLDDGRKLYLITSIIFYVPKPPEEAAVLEVEEE